MKRTSILCLMTFLYLSVGAQNSKKYYVDRSFMHPCPKADSTIMKGLAVVKWPSTEDRHVKGRDDIWLSNIPVLSGASANEFGPSLEYRQNGIGLVPFSLQMNEENGKTVLHCMLRMPADAVSNFWLASDEAAIVDCETGTQYRAIGCLPEEAWKKYFTFRAKKNDILDFQVLFPRLPETVKRVKIYGVPNWALRGGDEFDLTIKQENMMAMDEAPKMHKPTLVRPANNYTKDSSGSWSVYTDAHTIKPQPEGTMALWRTPDATYLAIAHEQNWMREYYGVEVGGMLIDDSGHQYKLKELQDYPLGELFWVEGYSGDCVVNVKVYEPLPVNVETITYIEPDGEPFKAWGANWKGTVKHNLNVEGLRANQRLFDYQPRNIVME